MSFFARTKERSINKRKELVQKRSINRGIRTCKGERLEQNIAGKRLEQNIDKKKQKSKQWSELAILFEPIEIDILQKS